MPDGEPKKVSKVEEFKSASRHLRGTIAERLADESTTHFEEADVQLLKFHGTYQQDDRDLRRELRAAGEEKAYQFMVRVAIPAGVVQAEQYLALDAIADRYANHSLRITTRQGIQFHGVLKSNLKAHIKAINDALLTTIAACGDVERNVMGCAIPLDDPVYRIVREQAREIAIALRPATRAYYEIWLDGEKQVTSEEQEPLYGDTYLPRKFKTGITCAGDASIDLYSYDCGLLAIVEDGAIAGYNVLVGGGMGMTHNKEDTFVRLASELGFVGPEHAVATVQTAAGIFRDFGNRADRRHARLKYLIEERGLEWFREEFIRRAPFELGAWRPMPAPRYHDFV
ncbi:MAG TPA: hypothetical protein P5572_21065, partial [Phycisphaerae bacterium]|nr:hypothetical protein [Phycisphaerae bacterium]